MTALALVCWVMLMLLAAEASWRLVRRHLAPRAAATAVLPATVVWRLAQVVALLLTGNPVGGGALLKLDPEQADAPASPRPPVVGPVLVALLPPACVMIAFLVVVRLLAPALLAALEPGAVRVPLDLPRSLPGFWLVVERLVQQLRQLSLLLSGMDYRDVRTWVGLYLLVCLGLRVVAPGGLLRAALLALLGLGVVVLVLSWLWPGVEDLVRPLHPGLSLVACWQLLVLSLIGVISGLVDLVRLLAASRAASGT